MMIVTEVSGTASWDISFWTQEILMSTSFGFFVSQPSIKGWMTSSDRAITEIKKVIYSIQLCKLCEFLNP